MGAANIRPLGDRILIERLEGNGIETVTKGGIVIPATNEARAKTKADMFRARVIAVGPGQLLADGERFPVGVEPGEEVLVYTWADGDGSKLYTGVEAGRNQLFISPDDVVCVVGPRAAAASDDNIARIAIDDSPEAAQ